MRTYYVGMDVHRASIMIVVLNGAGKVVMESVVETGAERVRGAFSSSCGVRCMSRLKKGRRPTGCMT